MSLVQRFASVLLCSALVWTTGCVGPMACGPCGSSGPVAFNSCDGCGDCQGCGELYIDPWINHPADVCDPCDKCGNFNGQSCGKCRSVFSGFASLWGYRRDAGHAGCDSCGEIGCGGGCGVVGPSCGSDGCDGCATCNGGGDGLMYLDGGPVPAEEIIEVLPTPQSYQTTPRSPKPIQQSYKPERTRKIFQPRPSMAASVPRASDY